MLIKIDESAFSTIFGKVEIATINKRMQGAPLTQVERNYLSRSIRPKLRAARIITEQKMLDQLTKGSPERERIEYNLNRYGYPLFAITKRKSLLLSIEELIALILTKYRSPRYIEAIPFLFLKNKIDAWKMLELASQFQIKNEIGYLLETAFLIKPIPQLKKLLSFLKKNKEKNLAFLAEGDYEFLLKTTPIRLRKWNLLGRFFDSDFLEKAKVIL
ncbi:hypothetical protein HZC31_01375 [Candidatus Woesearchaeota archaeon]|nr:hypothetical protein [Candidatus Woesearchaeota archaeon]